jgi:hypothetical protein
MSLQKAEQLELEIEELELADMSASEVDQFVAAMSPEGLELRRARKKVRYKLYRCRTESEGKGASEVDDEFKQLFETQESFDRWKLFGTTWDVAFDDPYRIVHKDKSEQEEWDELCAAKFPSVGHDGKITYPDIKVRKRVEQEAEKRGLI